MTIFVIVTSLLSLAIFAGFTALSVRKFGWQKLYSSYSSLWPEAVPIHNANLWSIVTVISALLLVPAMVERGEGNALQFIGFFAPMYLAVCGLTPTWETEYEARFIHLLGVAICTLATLFWIFYVCRLWWVLLIAVVLAGVAAYFTKTWKKSWVFWAEMAGFAAVYVSIFIG